MFIVAPNATSVNDFDFEFTDFQEYIKESDWYLEYLGDGTGGMWRFEWPHSGQYTTAPLNLFDKKVYGSYYTSNYEQRQYNPIKIKGRFGGQWQTIELPIRLEPVQKMEYSSLSSVTIR